METIIQKALKILLDKFGISYDCVTVAENSGHYRANIETPDAGRLIGAKGNLLDAIQILLKNILYHQNEKQVFVTVDVDGYRKAQDEQELEKVRHSIELMKKQNLGEVKLKPMRSYQRRLIHLWVNSNYPDMTTESIGNGQTRSIRIFFK